MTTSTSPSDPLRLSDAGELIAAIPAFLGFHPTRSLVVMSLTTTDPDPGEPRADTIDAVMRHDLLLPDDDQVLPAAMFDAFDRFRTVCVHDGADAALVVIVDDRLEDPAGSAGRGVLRVVECLDACFAATGIDVVGVHATTRIECGASWFVPGSEVTGTVADPDSSLVAATRVFHGGTIRRSRDELAAVLSPLPARSRTRIGELIDESIDARDADYARDSRAAGAAHADRRELDALLALVAVHADGSAPDARACAEMAVLLANPTVRDAALGLSVGDTAEDIEQVWIALARALPDPERADAAALVAFSAYLRGDGPFAGVALGAALESNPRHRLADLLDQALQAGLRPEAIRGLAETGCEIAARLGITLPLPGPGV